VTEEKKVITIDGIEYEEDQLTDEAKACINHIGSLDQKIASANFNLTQLQVGRQAFIQRLKEQLDNGQTDSSIST
jgi:septal ring factor EnvC (AmiA/AmiB activator)